MSVRLRELIRSVRSCKTAQEERDVIAKELAAIRTSFKDSDNNLRHRNIAKLAYVTLASPLTSTAFGQMECLKLIASSKFPEKRIGYLGLLVLLDERQEVLMLVTNSLKGDLNHPTQYIVGQALCALGNIGTSDMTRDLAPEVEKLLGSSNPYIRKKAALCAVRTLRRNPDLCDSFVEKLRSLLNDRNHGVLLCGVTAILELLTLAPQFVAPFRRVTPALVRILKSLVLSGYAPEHDIYGITDPFLQVKILRVLAVLGKGSPEASESMGDMLAQVATNTEANKTAGNAILYEAVNTIMSIEAESGLRVLAINILGRFLANRDNNIRYVALNTLSKVVVTDVNAVQRHRGTIVECLKDPDISIRRRALDLAYALINASNIKALARELLNFLIVADVEFKRDLTTKICIVVERYAPSPRWHVDTVIQVLTYAGDYVRDEVPSALIALIAGDADLHEYAVRRLYHAVRAENAQSLVRVASWCIGEFGEHLVRGSPGGGSGGDEELDDPVPEGDVLSLLEDILDSSASGVKTREYVLTALVKLTARFEQGHDRIRALLKRFGRDRDVEIQQRACEYASVLDMDAIRAALLEPMPVPERLLSDLAEPDDPINAGANQKQQGASPSSGSKKADKSEKKAAKAKAQKQQQQQQQQAAKKEEVDLLGFDVAADSSGSASGSSSAAAAIDLLGGVGAQPQQGQQGQQQQQQAAPMSDANMLLDLLGTSNPAPAAAPAAPMAPAAGGGGGGVNVMDLLGGGAPAAAAPVGGAAPGGFPSITGFQKDGLTVTFDCAKVPNQPHLTTLTASFTNSGMAPMSNFTFLAAVPKYLKMQLQPASSSEIPANAASKVTQVIKVANSMHGQKPIMLRIKIEYDQGGVHHTEQGQVDNFPQGV